MEGGGGRSLWTMGLFFVFVCANFLFDASELTEEQVRGERRQPD